MDAINLSISWCCVNFVGMLIHSCLFAIRVCMASVAMEFDISSVVRLLQACGDDISISLLIVIVLLLYTDGLV